MFKWRIPVSTNSSRRTSEIEPNFSNEENVFLPLLYSVLALGTLFARDDAGRDELEEKGYESAIAEG